MSETIIILILSGYAGMAVGMAALWKSANKARDKYEEQLLKQAEDHQSTVDALYKVVDEMAKGGKHEDA